MFVTAVILTKLPGHLPVKQRLWPLLGEAGARAFYERCLDATIALARRVTHDVVIAYSPPDAPPPGPRWRPVPGDDGAACLEAALSRAWRGAPLLALGGDAPDLPFARVAEAVARLADHDAVFVPTPDGGFSCLALRRPVKGLARGFAYGGAHALVSLERFLARRGRKTLRLKPWRDIDSPQDLHWRK